MSYTIISQERGYLKNFQVDTRADVLTLPVAPDTASGSRCLVLADSSIWCLDTAGTTWKELPKSGGGGGGGDGEPLTPEQMANILDIINGQ